MRHNKEFWSVYSQREVSSSLKIRMAKELQGVIQDDEKSEAIMAKYAKEIEQTCPMRKHPFTTKVE